MEEQLLERLEAAALALKIQKPFDGRTTLPTNKQGKKWKRRDPEALQGMVWHQELGWGSIEAVARYHTGPDSHLHAGGVESIAYTFAIRKNGQVVLCNDLDRAPWSQGYAGRKGDENAEFLSVMFEGFFQGTGVDDPSAGHPNDRQLLSGLILWKICQDLWKWKAGDLYGHFLFGKPACPGDTLQTVVEAVRFNAPKKRKRKFTTVRQRQQGLKDCGFYKAKVDGLWGPGSRAALIAFQKECGLAADGLWGPNTEAALLEKLEE
ncbi:MULTISPECIES: peptidoglycan recognition protein family protein [unclassified Nitrospina]|uniref:peptidoglycan recognition protein family protein n=1 Tax=unclassified Nitrospina TaxID=2638683 RepID=UPI003F9DA7CD